MKKLFLIDAYALIFRYYYAFMGRPMRNREGMNTSIVFGFAKFLRDIIKREKPDLLGVAFDPAGGSFRRELYAEYKANRSATPEDIITSVPYVKRLVEALSIPILEVKGYEADDVIGTLSHRGVEAGYDVYMVTPDKDYGQLVCDTCKMYKQKDSTIEIIDAEQICAKYGIAEPILVRDILAIWGDASDNIPGVKGIGEKGACKLVQEWGTVENIIDNVDKIKGKTAEKILASIDMLRLSKVLTTISLDVPIELDEQALSLSEPNREELVKLYTEMNFISMLHELGESPVVAAAPVVEQSAPAPKPASAPKAQPSLFDAQGDLFAQGSAVSTELPVVEVQAELLLEAVATAQSVKHDYQLVYGAEQLRELVAKLLTSEEFAFDTETTGFDMYNDRIVGLSLAVSPFEAWYVPFSTELTAEYTDILRPLFECETIAKIGQNIKFDIMVLARLGIEVRGRLFDTMILHYLLNAESRHNLTAISLEVLNYQPIEIETLIGRGARQLSMEQVALPIIAEYAAEDADLALRLKLALYPRVVEQGFEELYRTIEEPMIRLLADMELTGVKLDTAALDSYAVELNAKIDTLLVEIRELADDPTLNVNSPKQLGEVLFGKMAIAEKPKLTKTKQYCTDEEYLQSFAHKHKIVDLILEYRGVKKLLSTYVEALPTLVNSKSGRLHTSYNQAVTATGRLSSTNPNLQNIPIRDALGRPIRAAFIPTDSDHQLLSVDYSQVELRLMAHLSGDESLIEAFANGEDVHAATAAKIFGKPLEEVTSDDRRKAKTANFGIIYGISTFGLSQRLDIPRAEAKEIIDGYFASYPKVKLYMERVVEQARECGYVETLYSRRRYLRDITSRNSVARGLAERNAINAPIQGSAADIMKLAMVNIYARFAREGVRSKMIMQVHDEVVVDMLRSEAEIVERIVKEEMESAASLSVKLVAESGVGDNWLAAH